MKVLLLTHRYSGSDGHSTVINNVALALIKKNMPPEFQNSLNNLGLPFANFIDAISLYAQDKDKSVPKISISKLFKLK